MPSGLVWKVRKSRDQQHSLVCFLGLWLWEKTGQRHFLIKPHEWHIDKQGFRVAEYASTSTLFFWKNIIFFAEWLRCFEREIASKRVFLILDLERALIFLILYEISSNILMSFVCYGVFFKCFMMSQESRSKLGQDGKKLKINADEQWAEPNVKKEKKRNGF